MKANTETVLAWIGLSEGGYFNHPKDPGGATDRGITQRTYDAWNVSKGRAKKTVRGISKAEADQIVYEQYMKPIRFDDLPSGLDYAVADYSVNSGPSRAAKDLQLSLGMTGAAVDGVIGNQTLAAIERVNLQDLIVAYCERRMAFLRGLKTWGTFGKGWTTRVMGRQDGAQDGDIGVIDRAVRMSRGVASPAPVVEAPGKATESDTAESTWYKEALKQPTIWIPTAGGILSGITDGDGPLQWAIAAVIVIGAVVAGVRLLKRRS